MSLASQFTIEKIKQGQGGAGLSISRNGLYHKIETKLGGIAVQYCDN
jgi:hypothetical protein